MNTERSDDLRYLWWLILACVSGGLIYLLSPILTPFLLAAVIAYICNPMVTRMAGKSISRTAGTILVMFLLSGMFVALIFIMVPLFEEEARRLMDKMPAYLEVLRSKVIPWLEARFNISLQPDMNVLKQAISEHWQSAGGVAAKVLPSLTSGGMAIVEFLVNMLLVPVVLFYLLRDWDMLVKLVDEMIPRYWHQQISILARETDQILAEFLRGQLSVILLMSICYITGLWLAGLEFALPIGLVAGILVFVPYLGMIVGLTLATLAAVMQFQGLERIDSGVDRIRRRSIARGYAVYPLAGGGSHRAASGHGDLRLDGVRSIIRFFRYPAGVAGECCTAGVATSFASALPGQQFL
jgi:predicted PurR-regulated permease PerM